MAASKTRWLVFATAGVAALASIIGAVAVGIYLLWSGFRPPAAPKTAWTPPKGATLPVSTTAPDFTARDLNGNLVRLSDYRGKLVLLKIWSVTCGDCTVTMPREQEIYEQLDDNVVMLTVAVQSSEQSVRAYAEQSKIDYPVLLDPDNSFMALYQVKMTPTVYLIDPQGTIRMIIPMLGSAEDVNAYIDACGPACRPTTS